MSSRPSIVDDDLWALIEPLLPPWPEKAWQLLPLELEFGSAQASWRRLDRRQQAGVFDRCTDRIALAELNAARRTRLVPSVCGRLPHSCGG
jgi:transposase